MRPRSITGPLILVAIGVIFLLNNLGHDIPLWTYFVDYWPFLLIGIGVIQLAEVLLHVSRGSSPPRPGGGGWLWIVLFCLIVATWGTRHGSIGFVGLPTDGGISILGDEFQYGVETSSPAQGATRLVLDNIEGDVTIHGDPGGDVKVSGHKTIHAFSHNDADRADKGSAFHLERQGDSLVLKMDQPSHSGMLSLSSELDIVVPKDLGVETRGRGDLSIQDVTGAVNVTDSRGDIRLSNIGGDARVESSGSGLLRAENVKGAVDLEGRGGDVQLENVDGLVTINGEFSGTLEFHQLAKELHFASSRSDFRVEQIPGTVTMDLGDLKIDNAVGPVKFRTGTRDVEIHDVTNSLELNVDRGDVQISASKGPLPKMDVHTRNGDVSLTLPEKADFDLDGKTAAGEVDNEYGSPLDHHSDGQSAFIKGRVGSGPQLTIVTDRGTLSVKKD